MKNTWGPLVSIIIPAYNVETYIGQCLASIINQDYQNLEIILVNDGSTDTTEAICDKFVRQDARIRLICQTNQGVSKARNVGIDLAKGEYITFIDGDDTINQSYISSFIFEINDYTMRTGNPPDLIIGGYNIVDDKGNLIQTVIPRYYDKNLHEEWAYRISSCCSRMYSADFIKKYNVRFSTVRSERGEDFPVTCFANAMCQFILVLKKANYNYIQHSTSAMSNYRGFANYTFPYIAVEEMMLKIEEIGLVNSREFLEFGIIKIFAQFTLTLSQGASRVRTKELCRFIDQFIMNHIPNYTRSLRTIFRRRIDLPITHKAAIILFTILQKSKLLTPVLLIFYSRKNSIVKGIV